MKGGLTEWLFWKVNSLAAGDGSDISAEQELSIVLP